MSTGRLGVAPLGVGPGLLRLPAPAFGVPSRFPLDAWALPGEVTPERVGAFTCVPTVQTGRTECILEVTGRVLSATRIAARPPPRAEATTSGRYPR